MRTLIVYDTTGNILVNMSGDVREPVGVPFLWVDVPNGKRVKSIDVSKTPHVAVFEDSPKTQAEENAEFRKSIAELTILYASLAAGKDAGTPSATPTPAVTPK